VQCCCTDFYFFTYVACMRKHCDHENVDLKNLSDLYFFNSCDYKERERECARVQVWVCMCVGGTCACMYVCTTSTGMVELTLFKIGIQEFIHLGSMPSESEHLTPKIRVYQMAPKTQNGNFFKNNKSD
jgi:hypothetical protein